MFTDMAITFKKNTKTDELNMLHFAAVFGKI
jgi:hypothetical protein